ncbi:MAG: TIGR00289 family protein, partial [Methanoregula sp.]|nr:TIGR00289 family protein [Methanoregula sp.]
DLKQYVAKHRITLTGEGGEYETLVLDAPCFAKRIVIEESTEEYCNYRGILRVRHASLEAK